MQESNIAERLLSLGTGSLANQLWRQGIETAVMTGLIPISGTARGFAGRAVTLRYVPFRDDVGSSPHGPLQRDVVDGARPGDIIVVEGNGNPGASLLGDLIATRASIVGVSGFVVDGAVRDVAAIAALGLPVYARSVTPQPNRRFLTAWESNVVVGCGGVLVQPGDYVVGDADGVVVVPAAIVDSVQDGAEAHGLTEHETLTQLRSGQLLSTAYRAG